MIYIFLILMIIFAYIYVRRTRKVLKIEALFLWRASFWPNVFSVVRSKSGGIRTPISMCDKQVFYPLNYRPCHNLRPEHLRQLKNTPFILKIKIL